jgi:hypothetical protein
MVLPDRRQAEPLPPTAIMRLRLEENPREWMKFTLVASLFATLVATWLWHRHTLPSVAFQSTLAILASALALCLARPRWFRSFYRGGMTVGFHIGQVVGRVLLALCFLFVLIPIALFLRLQRRDLLELRRNPNATTYWKPARRNEQLDRAY